MKFFEQPPSKHWKAMRHRGQIVAEVWFKPEGDPFALDFRIPRKSFQTPDMGQRLTAESLLKAVGIAAEEVESWHDGEVSHPDLDGAGSDLRRPLPPPSQDVAHLTIRVRLKPPPRAVDAAEGGETAVIEVTGRGPAVLPAEGLQPEIPEETWQELGSRWKAIQGLEATVDTIRLRLVTLRADMEGSLKKTLTAEEKVLAPNADVSAWNKARGRVQFAIPKVKDFIHRATWATGTPERKQLEKVFDDENRPRLTPAEADRLRDQIENLLKDRQVLSALGVSVSQECEGITAEVQGALRTLQSNAAAKARESRNASRSKGKFFKDVRRLSGAG